MTKEGQRGHWDAPVSELFMTPSAIRSQEALKSAPPLRLTCGLHHRAKYANGI